VILPSGAVLPDPARTPGAVNPDVTQVGIGSTICVSGWTSTVRPPSSYTTSLKEQQLASGYAYRGDVNTSDYEEDHLVSLELGGSPTSIKNLWPEPYAGDGARLKDQVENRLHQLVCDHQLPLKTARHAIATNWYRAYLTYVGNPAPPTTRTTTTPATRTTTSRPKGLSCSASMSNAHPSDYSTVDVDVRTAPSASVTVTAHYKSTDTTHTSTANGSGYASIAFEISRATPGYTVEVDVSVRNGSGSASCSTSFTPQG
jgi:hypothetical protein